jgi:hypothetical protein
MVLPCTYALCLFHLQPRSQHSCRLLLHTGLALQRMGYLCVASGLQVRTALSNAICRKAFAMAHIHAEDAADVVSFMASDLMKVYNGMQVRQRGAGGYLPWVLVDGSCILAARYTYTQTAALCSITAGSA